MPRSLHSRTSGTRSARKISGGKSFTRTSCFSQSLIQVPSQRRPARPFLCSAENSLSFSVVSFSIPVFISILFTRERPLSITTFTPGTVSDVSAIAEERITRLLSAGLAGEIIRFCSSREILE